MGEHDLISRKSLLKELIDWGRSIDSLSENVLMAAIECVCERIEEAPAVDAEPVRHGRWGFLGMDMMAGSMAFYFGTCSKCRERINFEAAHKNYCPNCGAKMDLEVQDD